MNKLLTRITLLVAMFVTCGEANADLKVEGRPRWGFDGSVRLNDFNLFTVRVFNDSDKPWQGNVWLQPTMGMLKRDVPIVQPGLFIEPYGTRDLQFYPFVVDPTDFQLSWEFDPVGALRLRADGHIDIDPPDAKFGEVTIQLVREGSTSRNREHLAFDEQLFPSSAAVLRSVDTIILDRVPTWQNPQTQAFRDWLFGGGTVYLISDAQGESLQFSESLDELNEPSDHFPVGYGNVIRTQKAPSADSKKRNENIAKNSYQLSTARTLFAVMRAMTTPDHNWGLIYCMAIIYLLILFPGCWLLGWKKGDYRLTYSVILGTVALFSFGFHTVGKRGYGERTSVNSVAIVRPGQPGRWVVKQWSNLFITTGGVYSIEHEVDGKAVSTGQQTETVLGIGINQPDGTLQTDVPSFSNRTVVHTGVLKTSGLRPDVVKLNVKDSESSDGAMTGTLEDLELALPAGQSWPEMEAMHAIYRGTLYNLARQGDKVVKQGGWRSVTTALNDQSVNFYPNRWDHQEAESVAGLYSKTQWSLMLDDLGVFEESQILAKTTTDDRVHVYLLTGMDDPFFAGGEISSQQQGRVMYTFTLHPDRNEAK